MPRTLIFILRAIAAIALAMLGTTPAHADEAPSFAVSAATMVKGGTLRVTVNNTTAATSYFAVFSTDEPSLSAATVNRYENVGFAWARGTTTYINVPIPKTAQGANGWIGLYTTASVNNGIGSVINPVAGAAKIALTLNPELYVSTDYATTKVGSTSVSVFAYGLDANEPNVAIKLTPALMPDVFDFSGQCNATGATAVTVNSTTVINGVSRPLGTATVSTAALKAGRYGLCLYRNSVLQIASPNTFMVVPPSGSWSGMLAPAQPATLPVTGVACPDSNNYDVRIQTANTATPTDQYIAATLSDCVGTNAKVTFTPPSDTGPFSYSIVDRETRTQQGTQSYMYVTPKPGLLIDSRFGASNSSVTVKTVNGNRNDYQLFIEGVGVFAGCTSSDLTSGTCTVPRASIPNGARLQLQPMADTDYVNGQMTAHPWPQTFRTDGPQVFAHSFFATAGQTISAEVTVSQTYGNGKTYRASVDSNDPTSDCGALEPYEFQQLKTTCPLTVPSGVGEHLIKLFDTSVQGQNSLVAIGRFYVEPVPQEPSSSPPLAPPAPEAPPLPDPPSGPQPNPLAPKPLPEQPKAPLAPPLPPINPKLPPTEIKTPAVPQQAPVGPQASATWQAFPGAVGEVKFTVEAREKFVDQKTGKITYGPWKTVLANSSAKAITLPGARGTVMEVKAIGVDSRGQAGPWSKPATIVVPEDAGANVGAASKGWSSLKDPQSVGGTLMVTQQQGASFTAKPTFTNSISVIAQCAPAGALIGVYVDGKLAARVTTDSTKRPVAGAAGKVQPARTVATIKVPYGKHTVKLVNLDGKRLAFDGLAYGR